MYPNPKLSYSDKHNFALKDVSIYPNLSNSNKHNVALKDTENDEINGGKDSAIFSIRDVKDNPLVEFKPLNQTELGQFDDKILSKHPVLSLIKFGYCKTFWRSHIHSNHYSIPTFVGGERGIW